MYGAGKVNRLDFYKVKWHLKMYVVVLKVKAVPVRNLSSVKHKMQILSREDAAGIQGLPGPLVAVSAFCSRLDQVSNLAPFCRMRCQKSWVWRYLRLNYISITSTTDHAPTCHLSVLCWNIGLTQISPRARPTTGAHSDTTVPPY